MLFFAVAAFTGTLFVRALFVSDDIRSGLFTYAGFAMAVGIGLWRVRRWGRSLALIMAVGNAGLGAIALLSVILGQADSGVAPAVLFVLSVCTGYALSRPVFNLPDDYGVRPHD